jgi:hypothetical protein
MSQFSLDLCAETKNMLMMPCTINENFVHVTVLCFVLCTSHSPCQRFELHVFGTWHGPAWSNRESVHFFDFVFTQALGISKNNMIIMERHLVIISGSTAARDTSTLEESPRSVRISVRIYCIMFRELDCCYQYTVLCARSATVAEVCDRSAHCEGINSRQPHNPSTFPQLAAPTTSAHARAGATGSVRHKVTGVRHLS